VDIQAVGVKDLELGEVHQLVLVPGTKAVAMAVRDMVRVISFTCISLLTDYVLMQFLYHIHSVHCIVIIINCHHKPWVQCLLESDASMVTVSSFIWF